MTIPIKIPVTARCTITNNVFSATFNTTTPNRYDFTALAANQRQTVIEMNQSSVYIIERACFSMIVPEGEFQGAIDSAISVPVMKFETAKTRQLVFPRKQPFINYVDNFEMVKFIPCDQKDDLLQVSYEAVLSQTPAMFGILILKAFLQLTIYEIQSTDWVSRFAAPKDHQGRGLEMRGVLGGVFG